MKTDYDSPWKDILESYFQSALEFCFPQIARQIDWSKGVQLLSKEFQKIVRRSELGRRNVDVLVQVWTLAGREQWSYPQSSSAKWSRRLQNSKRRDT